MHARMHAQEVMEEVGKEERSELAVHEALKMSRSMQDATAKIAQNLVKVSRHATQCLPHTPTHSQARTHACTCTQVCTHTHTHTHACIFAPLHACMRFRTGAMYFYILKHSSMHTYFLHTCLCDWTHTGPPARPPARLPARLPPFPSARTHSHGHAHVCMHTHPLAHKHVRMSTSTRTC